ncbi:MAG: hypothetical protein CMF99_07320, partial [Candidatus Marinimicrobia bacterium]|nr:hypothetical protein [Candidatus Neomarinimicrobiota bacterium]
MKPFCISSLILFAVILFGDSVPKNDIVIFGHNYTGDLKDGKRHGNGHYIYPNGNTYEGQWENNLINGKGTFQSV